LAAAELVLYVGIKEHILSLVVLEFGVKCHWTFKLRLYKGLESPTGEATTLLMVP